MATFTRVFTPFDGRDTHLGFAALQLVPANANRILRLEAGAALTACRPPEPGPKASRHRWTQWLTTEPLVATASAEDPHPCEFVTAFTFTGGSYLLFPGPESDTPHILRTILEACFHITTHHLPGRFLDEVRSRALLVLTLSTRLARLAGLERGTFPTSTGQFVIPSTEEFERLKLATTISIAACEQAIAQNGGSPSLLQDYVLNSEVPADLALRPEKNPLLRRPLTQLSQDLLTIAAPHALGRSLVYSILRSAHGQGLLAPLAAGIRAVVQNDLRMALDILDIRPVSGQGGLYQYDRDRYIATHIITDDLKDWTPDNADRWLDTDALPTLQDDFKRTSSRLNRLGAVAGQCVQLVLIQGVGRFGGLRFRKEDLPNEDALLVRGDELRVLAILEGGRPTALPYFARARRRLHDRTRTMSFSLLDDYAMFKHNRYSFYMSDDRMDFILFQPGEGISLYRELFDKYDIHAATLPGGRTLGDVALLFGDHEIPIYADFPPESALGRLLIETPDSRFWVTTKRPAPNGLGAITSNSLVDAVAFWLWQLLRDDELKYGRRLTELGVAALTIEAEDQNGSGVQVDLQHGILSVTFRPQFLEQLKAPTNDAERLLVQELFRAVHVDKPQETSASERVAPLGPKRRIHAFEDLDAAILDGSDIPAQRNIQEALLDEIIDSASQSTIRELSLERGDAASETTKTIAHSMVQHHYQKLLELLGNCSDSWLSFVLGHNEALIREEHYQRRTVASRIACFFDRAEFIPVLKGEQHSLYSASIANRFLLEMMAAIQPNGKVEPSLCLYDTLLAHCGQVFYWGAVGDLAHYDLGGIRAAVLGSGRVGLERRALDAATDALMLDFAGEQVEAALLRQTRETIPADEPSPPLIERLDRAAVAEWGFSVTDLTDFCAEAINLTSGRSVTNLPFSEAAVALTAALGWTRAKVDTVMLTVLSHKRSDFMAPPVGFRREDIYPWRFNRELSYLRRPMIVVDGPDRRVLFGRRAMFLLSEYVLNLCVGGRLKARSQAMKHLAGEIHAEDGRAFNDRVLNVCSRVEGVVAKARVSKLGKHRAMSNGKDLGDIDVLVGIPRKRLLLALEAKSLARARTPAEFSNEMASMFARGGSSPSALEKHERRTQWLDQHKPEALQHLGLSDARPHRWKTASAFVLDRQLISTHLSQMRDRVWLVRELSDRLKALVP